MVIYKTKMGIVHMQDDGSILAGVFLISFVLCLSLQVLPTQQVAAYLYT